MLQGSNDPTLQPLLSFSLSNNLKSGDMKKNKPAPQRLKIRQRVTRRRYNSPLRQQQAAKTRESIIAAGVKLVHSYPAWDWTNLTALAVGERAGVSERTVQRHFPTERQLRDAVLQRVYDESGIGLDELELGTFANITARMFGYLSSFAVAPQPVNDPTFESMDTLRRDALFQRGGTRDTGWTEAGAGRPPQRCSTFSGIYPPYERLIARWGFDSDRAIGALTWLISLTAEAIRDGRHPDLASKSSSVSQPRTVEVGDSLALSRSMSHSGKRLSTSSRATRPSTRVSAAPIQVCIP